MKVIQFKFKKFSKIVKKLCVFGEVQIYNSKYSNRIFTNIQHLFLLVAKEHTTYGYRKFVESLYDSKIPSYISLKRIPHFTTLQKFAERISAKILNKLLFLTQRLFKKQGTFFGADSTGMELDHASAHYCKRIDRKKPVKGFVNLNVISDLFNKIILVTKIRKKRRHDCSDFMPMFNKVKHLDFDYFVADKGYDSEENHKAIFEAGKDSLISVRRKDLPIYKTKGTYRKKAKREFEYGLYTQRELTESIFSSLKRKYGSKLRARKYKTQKIELLCKILAYNIERAIRSVIGMLIYWKAFLQSLFLENI
ncbi:MAG: IS5 family transposase [Nanoarchaeota archaeon]|nr:IS5 family transposase [Nanoarchaeota archaeon]MBU1622111.1 IS5 family transposase [Nanoarchaeota archaeon]